MSRQHDSDSAFFHATSSTFLDGNNNNDVKKSTTKSSAKPSLKLYKPPVLRQSKRNELAHGLSSENYSEEQRKVEKKSSKFEKEPVLVEDFDKFVPELRRKLDSEHAKVAELLASKQIDDELAEQIGEYLVKYAIENCRQKHSRKGIIVRVFAQLSTTSGGHCADAFFEGICAALERYFECRDLIRHSDEHFFPVWKNFISLLFELGQIPFTNDRLAELIFAVFQCLFTEPIVCSLRICELESALSALMILGNNLELEYPIKMGLLRDQLRDAFLTISEGWARKMVLLMVELGANGWKMSSDLEEYYFH